MSDAPSEAAVAIASEMADSLKRSLQAALKDAVEKGQSAGSFAKTFEELVKKQGWIGGAGGDSAESRAWRARLIYNTYLSRYYAAERLKQMRSPYTLKRRPYWVYRHGFFGEPLKPRPEHVAWDGLVLPADHPWFATHFPPNGYNCSCNVEPITEKQLQEMGKDGPDEAPALDEREVLNPRTGEIEMVPKGIDPGFVGFPSVE